MRRFPTLRGLILVSSSLTCTSIPLSVTGGWRYLSPSLCHAATCGFPDVASLDLMLVQHDTTVTGDGTLCGFSTPCTNFAVTGSYIAPRLALRLSFPTDSATPTAYTATVDGDEHIVGTLVYSVPTGSLSITMAKKPGFLSGAPHP